VLSLENCLPDNIESLVSHEHQEAVALGVAHFIYSKNE
jgi:hypothetical protein